MQNYNICVSIAFPGVPATDNHGFIREVYIELPKLCCWLNLTSNAYYLYIMSDEIIHGRLEELGDSRWRKAAQPIGWLFSQA